jgi:hypothetical protein
LNTKSRFVRASSFLALAALALLPLAGRAAGDEDGPTVAKDWLQVTAYTMNVFHKNYDNWSWVPQLSFRVNGPVGSGSQLYGEFTIPGSGTVKFDCPTPETLPGRWNKIECGGHDIAEDKASLYTGPVDFAIKMRNELQGPGSKTLFSGKAKIAKVHSNEHGPKAVNKFVYFVDQDWNLPIGYVYTTPDDTAGWDLPTLYTAFWVRGDASNFQPHLFHGGQEVGKKFFGNDEVGRASCGSDIEDVTTHFVEETVPQKAKWSRIKCDFPNVRAWDNRKQQGPGMFGPMYTLKDNPGEYEFKVLWNNHLARTLKFTVGPDGKFDNGIATGNKLGSNRTIVPVQIIGDQDGAWDRGAWRTAAFYSNPLTGFTAIP